MPSPSPLLPPLALAVASGIGATVLMDAWLLLLKRAGVPTLDFALLGRWSGHLLMHARIAHPAIRQAAPIVGETALGWLTHYAVGMLFAVPPLLLFGMDWLRQPALLPALAWGVLTAAAPLLFLQPAMGAGIASRRTATPLRNSLRSLASHTVYGLGLYLSTLALNAAAGASA